MAAEAEAAAVVSSVAAMVLVEKAVVVEARLGVEARMVDMAVVVVVRAEQVEKAGSWVARVEQTCTGSSNSRRLCRRHLQ